MKFTFADMVVVREKNIGVVVKCWERPLNRNDGEPSYDVYVRIDNAIESFKESEIERYMVRHKYLSRKEKEYQSNSQK